MKETNVFYNGRLGAGTYPERGFGERSGRTDCAVTGEVIDLDCYLANGAHGSGHAARARKCIEAGLPAGIRTKAGMIYLLSGKRELLSAEIAARWEDCDGQRATCDHERCFLRWRTRSS